MTALPRNAYRDPLDAMLRAEEKTCKGCLHLKGGADGAKRYCGNPASSSLLATERCDEYEERT